MELGASEESEEKETEEENRSRKGNKFNQVCKRSKYRRVKYVVQHLAEDAGLETAVLERLKDRKESEDPDDDVSQEFKLAVLLLSLMKTLISSEKKLDDQGYWIQDMLRRGMKL